MSPDVTDPNNLPSSPTRAANVIETSSSFFANSCAVSRRLFSADSRRAFSWAMRLLVSLGRLERDVARQQVVARVAVGDGHDVAGIAQLLDRLP